MKRGTATEMTLAVLGVLAWFLLAFSNAAEAVPLAVLQVGIGAWSIAEIVRWQNGHSTHPWSSRRRAQRGAAALPTAAWFGLGATGGQLALAFGWGIVDGIRRTAEGGTTLTDIPPALLFVAAIACGVILSLSLVHASDRRERVAGAVRVATGVPTMPPPPAPGSTGDHRSSPLHDAGGPAATLYHLQQIHGERPDPFASRDELVAIHDGLHRGLPPV